MSQERSDDRGDAPRRPDEGLPPPPGPPREPPASFTLEHKRARRVIGSLVTTGVALVLSIVAEAYQMGVLARVADDGFVTRSEADTIDAWVLATRVLTAALVLMTGLAWLMWQHRAHVNVRSAVGGQGGSLFVHSGLGSWMLVRAVREPRPAVPGRRRARA